MAETIGIMRFRRCPGCYISPIEADVVYFWGPTPYDQSCDYCKFCRKAGKDRAVGPHIPQPRKAVIAVEPKLEDLLPVEIKEWFLTQRMRDRLVNASKIPGVTCFVSDGERLWPWFNFPYNCSNVSLGWDELTKLYDDWVPISDDDGPDGVSLTGNEKEKDDEYWKGLFAGIDA